MKGITAVYKGRLVSKEHFRVYIYAANDAKKLVESWDEYQKHMETGLWFTTKEDAELVVLVDETKSKKVRKVKQREFESALKELDDEDKDVVLEVEDNFLPKASE